MQFDKAIWEFSCSDFAARLQVAVTQHRSSLEPAGDLVGVIALRSVQLLVCVSVEKRGTSSALSNLEKELQNQDTPLIVEVAQSLSSLPLKGSFSNSSQTILALLYHAGFLIMLGSAF